RGARTRRSRPPVPSPRAPRPPRVVQDRPAEVTQRALARDVLRGQARRRLGERAQRADRADHHGRGRRVRARRRDERQVGGRESGRRGARVGGRASVRGAPPQRRPHGRGGERHLSGRRTPDRDAVRRGGRLRARHVPSARAPARHRRLGLRRVPPAPRRYRARARSPVHGPQAPRARGPPDGAGVARRPPRAARRRRSRGGREHPAHGARGAHARQADDPRALWRGGPHEHGLVALEGQRGARGHGCVRGEARACVGAQGSGHRQTPLSASALRVGRSDREPGARGSLRSSVKNPLTDSRIVLFAMPVGIVVTVGLLDYFTGLEYSADVFYLVPIAAAVWFVGRRYGVALAVVSAATSFAVNALPKVNTSRLSIVTCTTLIFSMFFLVVAWTLSRLRELQRQLERRVEERTAALRAEIAEREHLEKVILNVSETERQRIGRDLHDGLGQQLTAAALAAKTLMEQLTDAPKSAGAARQIVALVEDGIDLARRFAHGLAPVELSAAGLM